MNSKDIFDNHEGNPISKWGQYFPIYDTYFSKYKNQPVNILEIGVWKGGSLDMWRKFFGPYSKIVGIDIDKSTMKYDNPTEGIHVHIGDQSDKNFLEAVLKKYDFDFDIIIDDGSHIPEHQIKSFEYLYPLLKNGGVYFVEDVSINCDTTTWNQKSDNNFFEFINNNFQMMSIYDDDIKPITGNKLLENTISITYFDGGICFQKGKSYNTKSIKAGRLKHLREKASPILHKINKLVK